MMYILFILMSNEDKVTIENIEYGKEIDHFFARRLIQLESRVDSIETKVASLGKVVRLLQQYTEKKDQQYQKEANNFHLLQHKLDRIEELECQLAQNTKKYDEISSNAHTLTQDIHQLTISFENRQKTFKDTEERLNYEMQEVTQKLERLQNGLLQQMREEGKRHAETASKHLPTYNLDQLHFKIAQLEQAHRADYDKIRNKIEKIIRKPDENEYGLDQGGQRAREKERQKSKRKKSSSMLKRIKSK